MTATVNAALMGAVAMASFVAALFFLRFWSQTKDALFLVFSVAFLIDAVTRLLLGMVEPSSEQEPLIYLGRLVTFGLIIVAIINKNRSTKRPLN
jgi:hypothetical protein